MLGNLSYGLPGLSWPAELAKVDNVAAGAPIVAIIYMRRPKSEDNARSPKPRLPTTVDLALQQSEMRATGIRNNRGMTRYFECPAPQP